MSNATIKQQTWTTFLKYYSEQNAGRPTRLGVFDNGNDYWIEDGLPLSGIDFDTHGSSLNIQIMLGDEITRSIKNVRKVQMNFSLDELNDGLDITDNDGVITILRFEE